MAENNLPYMSAYGSITKALNNIKAAQTPDRFTQDFLASKLGLKGGSAKPVIPFLKKTAFLASDGAPTELYKRFRNPTLTGAAAAEAIQIGYKPLYEINEKAHELSEKDLKGLVMQATGAEGESTTVRAIIGSFKALRDFADFSSVAPGPPLEQSKNGKIQDDEPMNSILDQKAPVDIKLGYSITLQLPSTSDPAVYSAIFRSLREHLL